MTNENAKQFIEEKIDICTQAIQYSQRRMAEYQAEIDQKTLEICSYQLMLDKIGGK